MVEMMFQCLIRIGRLTQYSSISLSACGGWCDINCKNYEKRDKSNLASKVWWRWKSESGSLAQSRRCSFISGWFPEIEESRILV
jgi:hypothetical protein